MKYQFIFQLTIGRKGSNYFFEKRCSNILTFICIHSLIALKACLNLFIINKKVSGNQNIASLSCTVPSLLNLKLGESFSVNWWPVLPCRDKKTQKRRRN